MEALKKYADFARDLIVLAAIFMATRLAFIYLMPPDCFSQDVNTWMGIAFELKKGRNPYVSTDAVVWAPLIMQITYWVDHLAEANRMRFDQALRILLSLVDLVMAGGLLIFLQNRFGKSLARKLVYLGYVFNPITFLLTVQHGNFDGLVGFLVCMTAFSFVRYVEMQDIQDWLLGCLCVGVGILLKTTPMVMIPLVLAMLTVPKKIPSLKTLALGIFLVAAPGLLGLSIIYVLSPQDVLQKVFGYRSTIAYGFGYPWLIYLLDHKEWIGYIILAFSYIMKTLGGVGALAFFAAPMKNKPHLIFAYCVLLFAAITTFGSGHGNQYAFWYAPAAVALYAYSTRSVRQALLILYGIGSVLYILEYAFAGYLGWFLYRYNTETGTWMFWLADKLFYSRQGASRLPMFLAYHFLVFSVLAVMIREIVPAIVRWKTQIKDGLHWFRSQIQELK